MDIYGSCSSDCDDEKRVLEWLLDAFGSTFSLKEIASAYCKAGRNANSAAEILYEWQGNTSSATIPTSNGETRGSKLSASSSDNISESSIRAEGNSRASKPKKLSVSIGTVSSVIGKGYIKPTMLSNGSCEATKPLKLNAKDLPLPELLEKVSLDFVAGNDHPMHKDVEDFLFKMLGDGFQLDMNVIREVLGSCGYDVKKGMEKLLNISASTLDKSDDLVGDSTEKFTVKCPKPETVLCPERPQHMHSDKRIVNIEGSKPRNEHKERYDLQKEVLNALFNVPERIEDIRRTRPVRVVKGTRAVGHTVVAEPPRETIIEHPKVITEPLQDSEDDEEDSYQGLRKAAKEHWITMKEYYKAAVDAFAEGDRARADTLLEQGHFYNSKAREADESSSRQILECRGKEMGEEMPLDLHDCDTKEAIRLLKSLLTKISGIPAIRYLKVIVENNAGEVTNESRKKRLVIKLLEKESLKWTVEEENAGTILIRVDDINPEKLSFAKKAL